VLHLADVAGRAAGDLSAADRAVAVRRLLAAYRARGATPQIAQEAIQMQTIVNLVSAGMGVAWVPEAVRRFQRPGVVYRAVGRAPLRCQTSLVWRDQGPPVVQRFVAHVMADAQAQAQTAAPARRQCRARPPTLGTIHPFHAEHPQFDPVACNWARVPSTGMA
jgi:DNA-binding transcriptional LysR family regulator